MEDTTTTVTEGDSAGEEMAEATSMEEEVASVGELVSFTILEPTEIILEWTSDQKRLGTTSRLVTEEAWEVVVAAEDLMVDLITSMNDSMKEKNGLSSTVKKITKTRALEVQKIRTKHPSSILGIRMEANPIQRMETNQRVSEEISSEGMVVLIPKNHISKTTISTTMATTKEAIIQDPTHPIILAKTTHPCRVKIPRIKVSNSLKARVDSLAPLNLITNYLHIDIRATKTPQIPLINSRTNI